MNTGKLELMTTFVRVVETGSFTAVANESGASQPTVSRQVGALEKHLNVRLLQRTTRALTLTEEGRAYYERCRDVLDAVGQADASVRAGASRVSGTLRVAASLAFGRLHVLPRLTRFLADWPEVAVDLVLGDDSVNLVEERVDVAIRIGTIRDESLVARRIGETRRVAVATPAYLEGRARPRHPEELAGHECIVVTSVSTPDEWTFRRIGGDGGSPAPARREASADASPVTLSAGVTGGEVAADGATGPGSTTVKVSGRVRVNASGAVHEAVLGGFGIALTPTWQWRDEFERGELVRLLERYEPSPMPIHAVYASRRLVTPRVRAFVDFLAHEFAADPVLAGRGVASAAALGLARR